MTKCIKCDNPGKVKSGKYSGLCSSCRRKQYYLDNRQKESENCQKWYKVNRESEIIKNSDYRKQNKELFDWYHNKERFGGVKEIILKRDNHKCQICYTTEKLIVHHIDGNGYNKITKNNEIENLIVLCKKCHSALHHWQKKQFQLKSREDIVRTLGKPREHQKNGVIRRTFIY